jgi:hypothetical protein
MEVLSRKIFFVTNLHTNNVALGEIINECNEWMLNMMHEVFDGFHCDDHPHETSVIYFDLFASPNVKVLHCCCEEFRKRVQKQLKDPRIISMDIIDELFQ